MCVSVCLCGCQQAAICTKETSLSEVVLDWHAEDAPGPVACLEVHLLVEPRVLHAQAYPTGSEPP